METPKQVNKDNDPSLKTKKQREDELAEQFLEALNSVPKDEQF